MRLPDVSTITVYISKSNHGREASMAEVYINQHPSLLAACKEVFRLSEELIKTYKSILTESEVCKAKTLCWGTWSAEEYAHRFLVLVLMDYKVWEISEEDFQKRYKFISEKNSEWGRRFWNDYLAKVKRCKRELPYIAKKI